MKYSQILYNDIANGPGFRTTLFVSGCNHHCKGCFNSKTWDFNYGKEFTEEVINHICTSLGNDYIDGLTILGGEPLDPNNIESVFELINRVRLLYGSTKTIWIYTGYTIDNLLERLEDTHNKALETLNKEKEIKNVHEFRDGVLGYILNASFTNVIVDGPFIEDLKDIGLKFRGSSNQRLIDLKESKLFIDKKEIVLWNE